MIVTDKQEEIAYFVISPLFGVLLTILVKVALNFTWYSAILSGLLVGLGISFSNGFGKLALWETYRQYRKK